MTLTKQQQLIQDIHKLEVNVLKLLETCKLCVELSELTTTDEEDPVQEQEQEDDEEEGPRRGPKGLFDENCEEMSNLLSDCKSQFNIILEKVDPAILEDNYSTFPYKLSAAKEEKRLELQSRALDILNRAASLSNQ